MDHEFQSVVGELRGRQVLVTGARGFLAHSLIALLSQCDCRIRSLSHAPRSTQEYEPASAELEWQLGAFDDLATWQRATAGVDIVFHLAAQTSARVANADPLADYRANVLPAVMLLEACRAMGTRPAVLFAGTVTQAGCPQSLPVNEDHPDDPLTTYDLHKCLAERYLEFYRAQHSIVGAALRLPNLYGPGPESDTADRGVLNAMIRRAMFGQTLTIYGNGGAIRDYLFVEDAAWAFLLAAVRAPSLQHGHYVIGTGHGHTIAEAIGLVAQQASLRLGREVPVVHVEPSGPRSGVDQRNFVANPARFCRDIGWRSSVDLATGIARMLEAQPCVI